MTLEGYHHHHPGQSAHPLRTRAHVGALLPPAGGGTQVAGTGYSEPGGDLGP